MPNIGGVPLDQVRQQRRAADALFAAAPELLSVIKGIEWGGLTEDEDGEYRAACPWCDGMEPVRADRPAGDEGHADGCPLQAVIRKAEGRP